MPSDIAESNTAAEVNNSFALTPEHTLSLWATVLLPWDLTVGGGTQYMDAVFRNATNTAVVPGYWLVNGLVSYDVNQHSSGSRPWSATMAGGRSSSIWTPRFSGLVLNLRITPRSCS